MGFPGSCGLGALVGDLSRVGPATLHARRPGATTWRAPHCARAQSGASGCRREFVAGHPTNFRWRPLGLCIVVASEVRELSLRLLPEADQLGARMAERTWAGTALSP